jgi:hypothetical protein
MLCLGFLHGPSDYIRQLLAWCSRRSCRMSCLSIHLVRTPRNAIGENRHERCRGRADQVGKAIYERSRRTIAYEIGSLPAAAGRNDDGIRATSTDGVEHPKRDQSHHRDTQGQNSFAATKPSRHSQQKECRRDKNDDRCDPDQNNVSQSFVPSRVENLRTAASR